jgi:hypothetical protein
VVILERETAEAVRARSQCAKSTVHGAWHDNDALWAQFSAPPLRHHSTVAFFEQSISDLLTFLAQLSTYLNSGASCEIQIAHWQTPSTVHGRRAREIIEGYIADPAQ